MGDKKYVIENFLLFNFLVLILWAIVPAGGKIVCFNSSAAL